MCNNRKPEEVKKFERLGEITGRILRGESLQTIADDEDMTVEALRADLEEIKAVNPLAYSQVMDKLKE